MPAPLLALLLLALTGCTRQEFTIEQVLQQRERALATANATLYASLISPAYRDRGVDSRAKREELAKTLAAFGPVSYRSLDRSIVVHGDSATVTGRYAMKVTAAGKPLELAGEETIRLHREAGGWKIVGGI
uniref:Nuclear transport factor 2 family protein n=1 Tax=Geobacter metallireducens TaxID=28232 RepID=A0A831XE74_GEOME